MVANFKIETVGVAGAGTMGAAIAQYFAMKGLQVHLFDINSAGLERGRENILSSLAEAEVRKVMTATEKEKMVARLHVSTDINCFSSCQLVVEAVFEDFKVKTELFKKIESVTDKDCIVATNTSSFSVTDLARGLKRPERFVGVHYFYHAAKNKLIEVIPGAETAPDVTKTVSGFYEFIDKLPITTADVSGFCVNRFFVPWLNEAVRLWEEGHGSPEFIDAVACKVFRIGMGPFALMNATGVPIAMHAAENLADKFGRFYRAAPALKAQVSAGKPWDLTMSGKGRDDEDSVRSRLLASALGVAAQMVSEGVADATATDLGARIGLRWGLGPFEMMEKIGVAEVREKVRNLFSRWELPVPSILTEGAASSELQVADVRYLRSGKLSVIEFNRPDAMNALSERVMQQLTLAFEEATKDSETSRIAFVGRGKAFVAGADIKFFLKNMDRGNTDNIYRFTEAGQKLLRRIETCQKPTIAYLDGLTLGGGLELALACQYRIATPRLTAGFPETGIGIYPGLGGTQRAPRLVGKGLAKFLIATGQMLDAEKARQFGLVDLVVPRQDSFSFLETVELVKNPVRGAGPQVPEAGFAGFDGSVTAEMANGEPYKNYSKTLGFKAPLALKKSMELIDRGSAVNLDDGLQLELAGLHWIFETGDARTGLESIIKKERPKFKGV